MTTRDLTALLWFGLCCVIPFACATTDLPIETALLSLVSEPATQPSLDTQHVASDIHTLSAQEQQHILLQEDMQILWPMMPKETLAKLADSFYPDSPILAQRFIQKSIRLSRALGVIINPNAPFEHAQIIAIPNEKEVRALTHRIKKTEELTASQEQLKLSYQLKQIIPTATKPPKNSHHSVVANISTGSVGLDLPDLQLPSLKLPPMQSPKLESLVYTLQSIWHSTLVKVDRGVQSVQDALSDWSASLSRMWSSRHTKSLVANPHPNMFDVAFGLALMLFLALLGWILQRRYHRRKITLLNAIQTTLVEPTISDMTYSTVVEPEPLALQAEQTKPT